MDSTGTRRDGADEPRGRPELLTQLERRIRTPHRDRRDERRRASLQRRSQRGWYPIPATGSSPSALRRRTTVDPTPPRSGTILEVDFQYDDVASTSVDELDASTSNFHDIAVTQVVVAQGYATETSDNPTFLRDGTSTIDVGFSPTPQSSTVGRRPPRPTIGRFSSWSRMSRWLDDHVRCERMRHRRTSLPTCRAR